VQPWFPSFRKIDPFISILIHCHWYHKSIIDPLFEELGVSTTPTDSYGLLRTPTAPGFLKQDVADARRRQAIFFLQRWPQKPRFLFLRLIRLLMFIDVHWCLLMFIDVYCFRIILESF
jgi:hypothetical protein